jgi:phage baseplate assembly protein V
MDGMLENVTNRLRMMIGRGRVTATNDSGSVQMLQIRSGAMETGDNRPRLAEFGLTSVPPDGSDVAYLSLAGDRTATVVIATGHQASRPKGLKAGESMLYSQDGKQVYLEGGQIQVQANGMPVNVINASTVAVTASSTITLNAGGDVIVNAPLLKCSGDIVDNYGKQGNTMAGMRADYNIHTHQVTNVQTGGSTVTTNPPNQPQVMRRKQPRQRPRWKPSARLQAKQQANQQAKRNG